MSKQTTPSATAQSYAALREKLGKHYAPEGLYLQNKQLPFVGRVGCNVERLETGSWNEIVIDYEVGAAGLADGGWFKATFKFYSDWALFQTSDPTAANYISAEYQSGKLVAGQSAASVQSLSVRFDQKGHERPFQKSIIVDVVDGYLNAGDHIIIRLGDRRGGGPGTRVQTFTEDRFRFRCYVDPLGTSRFAAVPGDIVIDMAAGAPARLLLAGPRFARPGERVPFRVSAQDRWGNVCQAAGGAIRLRAYAAAGDAADGAAGDEPLYDKLLPLPEQGWASVGADDLPADADLRVVAELVGSRDVKPASALLSVNRRFGAPRSFYADLHVHAGDTVGTNSPAYNAAYARDVGGIDVLGYTANDFQITDANWQLGVDTVEEFNRPGHFVCYPVQEWCGSSTAGGDHNVVFLGDAAPDFPYNKKGEHNRTFLWNEDMKGAAVETGRWPVEELWAAYVDEPEQHLIMPHVGGRRYIPDWHHPELERLVEIASSWGHFGWLYQDVIARGYQIGVAASGDEHRGRPGGGPPGTQVFGVHGGLTGVLAEQLDRASIGRALRARHTWATTGEHTALLVKAGPHVQGDAFRADGPLSVDYQFLGGAGWDEIAAYDHTGQIWRRNLHEELGFSERLIRLRWGGARIPDRYRWASWKGRITVVNGTVNRYQSHGFEHGEEVCWRDGPNGIAFRSDTYGDADSIDLDVSNLRHCTIKVEGTIDSYVKVGDPLQRNPFVHAPQFSWQISGAQLLEEGGLRLELGGAELFLALERLTEQTLPAEVSGTLEIDARNGPFGHRPVYFFGRQRDDSKVWSSALFVTFDPAAPA